MTDHPWQTLNKIMVSEAAANFQTPPPEYGVVLWWGWDGPLTKAVISRDLDDIQRRGIAGVMIEAGYGMSAPYLSPGWFELVRFAVEQARQRNMRVWLVDEGKYPSGFAGGKFSAERPDLRMQGLVVAERIALAAGEKCVRRLAPSVVSAVAFNPNDQRSQRPDVTSGWLEWTAPGSGWEIWLVAAQFRSSVTRAVNNPTRGKDDTNALCDYLNSDAARQFLTFTHERYKEYVGAEFGRTILGFRGDEPDFAYLPWTTNLPLEFEKRKGYDVRPYLASFFLPERPEEIRRVKADYWDVWSDLFRDNFFQIQADWCAAHKLEYAVHLNHEDQMSALIASEGDFFKAMRPVHIPGVDAIWDQIWPGKVADFPKLASSAAHVCGRPRAFSESFAAYRPAPTVAQAQWIINQQFVRGINLLEVMFYPSSATPQQRSGWMESPEFPSVMAAVHRASYLLTSGRPAAQIALYFPTANLWLGDAAANASVWEIARQLLEQQRDFDFVDDYALASLMGLEQGTFTNRSGQSYHAVILPSGAVMSQAALERLRVFAQTGGCVVFLGHSPTLVVEQNFLHASGAPDLAWTLHEPSGQLTPQVNAALPAPDVELDQPCPALKYLHRRWRDADLYFFFNEGAHSLARTITLTGSGQIQQWDTLSGWIKPLSGQPVGPGRISVALDLAPHETRFIVAVSYGLGLCMV